MKIIKTKHGHAPLHNESPTYKIWKAMHVRCRSKRKDVVEKYSARGIKVCDRWHDFTKFLEDMGERPDGMSIERENNDLGYGPDNCVWANATAQARNRRSTKLTYEQALEIARRMLAGESSAKVAKDYGVSKNRPRAIHKGWDWKDAHDEARRT